MVRPPSDGGSSTIDRPLPSAWGLIQLAGRYYRHTVLFFYKVPNERAYLLNY